MKKATEPKTDKELLPYPNNKPKKQFETLEFEDGTKGTKKALQNMESLEKEMIQWVDELDKINNEKIFDKSIANAMANANVEMSINKNKANTG